MSGPTARRPRIAHLTTADVSLVFLLGFELRADQAAGAEVIAISAPGEYTAELEADGIEHHALPTMTRVIDPVGDLRAARDLFRILRTVKPDVLHTHTPKTGVLGRAVVRAAKVPVIVNTCHGLWA